METQKTINEFNYQFRGNLNTPILSTAIIFVIPIFFALLILATTLASIIAKLIGIAVVFALLIYFFIKFDSESNVVLFGEEEIIHFKKKVVNTFPYSELYRIEIVKRSKSYPVVDFRIKGNEFSISLEKKNYANFTYDEFAEYLFKKNSSIVIAERDSSREYRYVLENGEILKIRYKNKRI